MMIAAVVICAVVIAGVLVLLRDGRKTRETVQSAHHAVTDLGLSMNGRFTEMLELTDGKARAEQQLADQRRPPPVPR